MSKERSFPNNANDPLLISFPQLKCTADSSAMWLQSLRNLRCATVVLILCNAAAVATGAYLINASFRPCQRKTLFPFLAVSFVAAVRIAATIQTGIAQKATAKIILESPPNGPVSDTVARIQKRTMYKKWLCWSRFALMITVLQFVSAIYLILYVAAYKSQEERSTGCLLEANANSKGWDQNLLVLFMVMACVVALGQCLSGSEVFKWRSFYAAEDDAWKAHYQEVFDQGIREALCCLGRIRYLSALEEDEVHSVAQLLGDLVAYRASGTGHLELLAGLALIEKHSQSPKTYEGFMEAPQDKIQEAIIFHKFAEAAYTGPLLDVGRNPCIFPCAWLYRQGILTPWSRNRRPKLDGDNWWRGHAAAFLKYVQLSPEALRQGRVCQTKCEAAYFVVVLHHFRTVVVAVRGTETPEDLITDGLCKECILSEEDLDGLINNSHIHTDVEQSVKSSFPHHGHSGIVKAARDLFKQIEGNPRDATESSGLLSSLLGPGCECEGYMLRIVGHSLGGAIASLLGLRLYRLFPGLHVHAFGPLPCMDSIVANACSEFITSIVYNDEFSSRLSVGSILRLRAAAITALSKDTETNSAAVLRLARRFLHMSKYQRRGLKFHPKATAAEDQHNRIYDDQYRDDALGSKVEDQEYSLWHYTDANCYFDEIDDDDEFINPFHDNSFDDNICDNAVSKFMEIVPNPENKSVVDPPEVFLPGFVIHIVPLESSSQIPRWKGWRYNENAQNYRAYIADRLSFKDIIVSRSMFLDHLPWRCHYVLEKVLEARTMQHPFNEPQRV